MSDADREWIVTCAVTKTTPQLQPLYLLADSQLLFWKRQDRLLLEAALDGLVLDTPLKAAYIGASNGESSGVLRDLRGGGGCDCNNRPSHDRFVVRPSFMRDFSNVFQPRRTSRPR